MNSLLHIILVLAFIALPARLVAAGPVPADGAPPVGLLLGIRTAAQDYHTLYITHNNGAVELVRQGPGLLVPRADGFWLVERRKISVEDAYRHLRLDFDLDFIAVRRADSPAAHTFASEPGEIASLFYHPQAVKWHYIRWSDWVTFVGPDYITLREYSTGFTGGAHPWQENMYHTYRLDDLAREKITGFSSYQQRNRAAIRRPLAAFLGPDAQHLLNKAARRFLAAHPEKRGTVESKVPDDTPWGLARGEGHWLLLGRLGHRNEVVRGSYALFDTGLVPPRGLVSHDALPLSWAALKAILPDSRDAFSPPRQDLVVVLAAGKLLFYPAGAGGLGPLAGEIGLAAFAEPEIVMLEWCTGDSVAAWGDAADKYLP